MAFQNHSTRTLASRRSAPRKLFGFGKLVVFVAVVCGGGWLLFQQTVHRQLRDRVQARISDELSDFGLTAKLGQARFYEGQGIQLVDLEVGLANTNSNGPHSRIEIYEVFLNASTTMTQLASSNLNIQSVQVRRAKLTVVRNENGQWDFQPILESLAAFKPESSTPISLTDCEIRIIDLSKSNGTPISLSNFNLYSQPREFEGRQITQLTGGFQSQAISQIDFTTYLDRQTQSWQSEVRATSAKLSGDLISVLPPNFRAEFKDLQSFSGRINLQAKAHGRMSLDAMPTLSIEGDIADLTIDDTRLPLPIRNVSANFFVNNVGFEIRDATGKLGLANFSGNYWQHGFLSRHQWHCDGKVNQFNLDQNPRLAQWIPAYCKKFCDEYSPVGTSNVEFDLTFDGRELKRKIIGELTDMSFSYINMPYKIENSVGKIYWIGDVCEFDLRSYSRNEIIELKGWARGLGKEPTYEVNISVPGELPIDRKMHAAIAGKKKFSEVVDSFNLTGHVTGRGKIEKRVPGGETIKTFNVRLKRCSIRHDKFRYPIHNVKGLIQARNDNYSFVDLSGINSSGKVTCNGNWNPNDGLNVRFLCNSVPLDDQLKFALKPEHREIWSGFRPRGTLDFIRVDLLLPNGSSEVDLEVEASMKKPTNDTEANYVSIYPVWFPYEINQLIGTVSIGNGEIKLTDCVGKHQRTQIYCQGAGTYSEKSWDVTLGKLLVTPLKIDDDLLNAVPSELAPPIRKLEFSGLLGVEGEIHIGGSADDPRAASPPKTAEFQTAGIARGQNRSFQSPARLNTSSTSLSWRLRLDMDQAKMQLGLPVENVCGSVKLVGEYRGQKAECRGDLEIDSLSIYQTQITNIRGPILLDNFGVAAGQFAVGKSQPANSNISPIVNPKDALNSVTGNLHKGTVEFDAKMDSGANNEYEILARLANGCLTTGCREFGADTKNIAGESSGNIWLKGDNSGIHSQRGGGKIQVSNAKIYELPVVLSLLKILNVRQPSRTAFDSSNIDFTVQGENIYFKTIEFLGDAISLIGHGEMNLDREIDLNFYSIMGRNRYKIPVLSDLYRASSQEILWIKVDGTLENPQTHHNMFSQLNELNESIRELFQLRESTEFPNRIDQPGATTANLFDSPMLQPRFQNKTRR